MRDSIGGTFLITILMVFIVLFVSFTAIIVNVTKTFRVKNGIVNIIEQHSGANNSNLNGEGGALQLVDEYLANVRYDASSISGAEASCTNNGAETFTILNDSNLQSFQTRGYCLQAIEGGKYFKVTVYVYIHLPFFDLDFTIPVSGETKSYQTLGS